MLLEEIVHNQTVVVSTYVSIAPIKYYSSYQSPGNHILRGSDTGQYRLGQYTTKLKDHTKGHTVCKVQLVLLGRSVHQPPSSRIH